VETSILVPIRAGISAVIMPAMRCKSHRLSSIGYVRAGKLRALAVTTTTRSPMLPDVPALSETLPGYEASVCRRAQTHWARSTRRALSQCSRRSEANSSIRKLQSIVAAWSRQPAMALSSNSQARSTRSAALSIFSGAWRRATPIFPKIVEPSSVSATLATSSSIRVTSCLNGGRNRSS
jgi:hypothetical protein